VNSAWRKSTYSGKDQCIEVANPERRLAVRDSKDPAGPQLAIDAQAWDRFMSRVKQTS
jgi:uncharacterized protein DUF397